MDAVESFGAVLGADLDFAGLGIVTADIADALGVILDAEPERW